MTGERLIDTTIYDVIVAGLGPAGLTACLYAARDGLKVLGLDPAGCGGKLLTIDNLENYPGETLIKGPELAAKLEKQIQTLPVKIAYEQVQEVTDIDAAVKSVQTRRHTYRGRSLILATGCRERTLGLEAENELRGRGVSYCAVCDGRFYKDKDVLVIGGGNSAFAASTYLSRYVKSVKQVLRRDVARANKIEVERVLQNPKVQVFYNLLPQAFLQEKIDGEEQFCGMSFCRRTDGQTVDLQADGVFIMAGEEPNSGFLQNEATSLLLDRHNCVQTDRDLKTVVPGVFAAGDVRDTNLRQVVTAAADGALAAYKAQEYLSSLN